VHTATLPCAPHPSPPSSIPPQIGRNPSAMLLSLSPLQEDEAGNTVELLHSDSESQGPGSGPGPPATSSAAKRDLKKASSARVYRISVCAGATLCASLYFKPSRSKVWDFELPIRLQGILSEKISFSEGACVCIVCCMQHIALMKYRGFDDKYSPFLYLHTSNDITIWSASIPHYSPFFPSLPTFLLVFNSESYGRRSTLPASAHVSHGRLRRQSGKHWHFLYVLL
jgi:hypothetical protein